MSDETTTTARDWGVLRAWHARNRIGNCRTCGNAWPCWAIQATDAISAAEAENARLRERVAALEGALKQGRWVISDTLDQVTPECQCGADEFCNECLPFGTLEQALAALAQADERGAE